MWSSHSCCFCFQKEAALVALVISLWLSLECEICATCSKIMVINCHPIPPSLDTHTKPANVITWLKTAWNGAKAILHTKSILWEDAIFLASESKPLAALAVAQSWRLCCCIPSLNWIVTPQFENLCSMLYQLFHAFGQGSSYIICGSTDWILDCL